MNQPTYGRMLNLDEVADLLGIELTRKRRRERVIRMFRRLEQRDGAQYLHSFGAAKNSWLWVSMSAVELAMPWRPNSLVSMRDTDAEMQDEIRNLKRRVNALGARLRRMEKDDE